MKVIVRRLQTPDGTILESRHVHDFQLHDDANGKHYMLDGGSEYFRRSDNGDELDVSITTETPFLEAREVSIWGSRGKCGTQPLMHIPLKDMESDHIRAVLREYGDNPLCGSERKELFLKELLHRADDLILKLAKRLGEDFPDDGYVNSEDEEGETEG